MLVESPQNEAGLDYSEIQKYYSGSTLLITGGTGFLGKVLVEKLLRSCPGIAKIYLLVRQKKGVTANKRFTEQFSGPLFDKMKLCCPNYEEKVAYIEGDIAKVRLGVDADDYTLLTKEVNLIFHVAATVRFDEKLKIAVDLNVRAVKEMLELSKQTVKLKGVIHVSTAYSNCFSEKTEEKFYPTPLDTDDILAINEILDSKTMDSLSPKIMGMWPNTYAFTKALGEDVVRAAGKGLPIAVIRPSIVIGTAREPIEGWTNNLYGPNGVVAGAGLGLLRSFYCNKDFVADLVPVDLCVNAIIALPWYRENIRQASEISTESKKDPPILNYISSHKNPITWGEFMKHNEDGLQRPSVHCIWYYFFALNKNYFMHLLYVYILQMVPAMILDLVSTTLGKTPILWKTYRKIHRFTSIISYFSMKEFKFEDNNVDSMWEKMGAKDRQLFDFNIASLNWKSTISNGILGLRLYLVNDPIETLPEAKKRFQKLKIAHYTLMVLFWLMIIYLVFKWALLPFFNFLNLH